MNFQNLRDHGITPTLFSEAFGYARPTCSLWFGGKKQPHFLHREKVSKIVTSLNNALAAGEKLDLSDEVSVEDRAAELRSWSTLY